MRSAPSSGASVASVAPDATHPLERHAVGVALVVARRDPVLEQLVERGRLEGVALAGVARGIRRRDDPAVVVAGVLGPPAVEDRQVERAVHRGLHARRAARLERTQRVVQPHVAARVEQLGHAHVVVGQEHDALAQLGLLRELHELLDEALALVVGGVRLAGDHELHGPLGVREDRLQPLGVAEHEREALVRRHAAGEPDRQRVGVEHARDPRRRRRARRAGRSTPRRAGAARPRRAAAACAA